MPRRLKTFRPLLTDEDAERAIEEDLSEYDLSGFRPAHEVFPDLFPKPLEPIVLPDGLRAAVTERAAREGVTEDEFVRRAVERAVAAA